MRNRRKVWRELLLVPGEKFLWAQQLNFSIEPGRPALFLDRDGVIVEEVHFLSRAEDAKLVADVGLAIASVNRAGFPVVVVTNQSGIGRGLFGWPEFANVQNAVNVQLAAAGARLDAVLACGYQPSHQDRGAGPDHPWRKPGGGMLLTSGEMLKLDLRRSYIIGDRLSDLHAGFNAGLAGGWLVMTGYGAREAARLESDAIPWRAAQFKPDTAPSAVEAIERFLKIAS